jgi:U4/U6.U5 small nuclear ribonucleoproteins
MQGARRTESRGASVGRSGAIGIAGRGTTGPERGSVQERSAGVRSRTASADLTGQTPSASAGMGASVTGSTNGATASAAQTVTNGALHRTFCAVQCLCMRTSKACCSRVSSDCRLSNSAVGIINETPLLCRSAPDARDGSPRASKRRRPSRESPELEEGQLPMPPPPAEAHGAAAMDVDGEEAVRSPRAQEARRRASAALVKAISLCSVSRSSCAQGRKTDRWCRVLCLDWSMHAAPCWWLQSDLVRSAWPAALWHTVCHTVSRERRRERKRREKEERQAGGGGGGGGEAQQVAPDMTAGLTADEIAMMQSLGLPFGFQTTQGAEVEDAAANESAMKVTSQRQPRQFMNRKGGFNRMLPAEKTGQRMQQV